MKLETRIKAIVTHTIEDFNNSGSYFKESNKKIIKWLASDLMNLKDIEELSTIEISLLILQKLDSLDLVNLEMITETITNSKKSDIVQIRKKECK
jgi:hypothetical protein